MKEDRIVYIDCVKLITIYLVILGHVVIVLNPDLSVGGRLYTFIYTFHMPLFVLLSGYFVSSSLEKSFSALVLKKALRLLLPAVSCTLIACLYLYLFRDSVNYRNEVIGNSWFLKILFVYNVLFYVLKQTGANDWLLFIGSSLLLFIIPHAYSLQLNLLYPYFWGGYLLRKYQLLELLGDKKVYTLLSFTLFFVLYAVQYYFELPIYIPITTETIISQGYLILFRYLIGFAGCMMVILAASLADGVIWRLKCLRRLVDCGRLTLGIYVLQTILIINIFPDVVKWNVDSEFMLDIVVAPLISLFFLTTCVLLIKWLGNIRIADLLLFGGQYYRI